MDHRLPTHVTEQFTADDTIDMNAYVDNCRCHCRTHITVKDGLLNVHGRAIFDRVLIRGDLNLAGDTDIQRLPDLLAATGSVYLSDCPNLKIMPSRMYAGQSIRLERTNIRDLPATMMADRDIYINDCPNVFEVLEGVRADCLYAAGCTKLKSIASGLEYHVLDLSGTPIASLPSKLTIKNELKLRNCTSLALIEEGVTVAKSIDVRGCDMLFTLPRSIQPPIVITDGMMVANDWVVVPEMSAEEASMCLGFKGIEGFPHRVFKNLDRMQDPILSIERGGKGFRKGRAVGFLKSDRVRHGREDFLRQLVQRLDDRDALILAGPVQVKRLT